MLIRLLSVTLSLSSLCTAQVHASREANNRLTPEAFAQLGTTCAPEIPLITLRAIARTESDFHPFALSLNYPRHIALEHGHSNAGVVLSRQPKTLTEARAWTHWFLRRGYSVSIGLMQINTQHAADLGLTPDQLFDSCTNARASARLLARKYQRAAAVHGEGQEALWQALSEYNSGSWLVGFENGYVSSVVDGEFHRRTSQP
jgi:type IV secretion system protein VirB1